MKNALITVLIGLVSITFPLSTNALMTSTNYRVYGDELGGSGARSTSASYILSDTFGDVAGGRMSSTNYELLSGFQELSEHPTFSFSISSATVDLGVLSGSSVSSSSHTISSSTNAYRGYTTTVVTDGTLRTSEGGTIDAVSDGTVSAGSEEYGIALVGSDRAFSDDRGPSSSALTVASRTNWKNGAQIAVTYKASIGSATQSGAYSQVLTYVSVGNF
ncbi:MAG: hypothetical protein AAB570_00665 [Patescibacteria group bacterium]